MAEKKKSTPADAPAEADAPAGITGLALHTLAPPPGSKKAKRRVGRGIAAGRGKTAGRGMKGIGARGSTRLGFEGGQMPLIRRIPKLRGFTNVNKVPFNAVNVGDLESFDADTTVGPDEIRGRGLAKKKGPIKILASGDLTKALTVQAHAFSAAAEEKITTAGGSVERVG